MITSLKHFSSSFGLFVKKSLTHLKLTLQKLFFFFFPQLNQFGKEKKSNPHYFTSVSNQLLLRLMLKHVEA